MKLLGIELANKFVRFVESYLIQQTEGTYSPAQYICTNKKLRIKKFHQS